MQKIAIQMFSHFAVIKTSFPKREKVQLCTKQKKKNDLQTLRA